MTSIGTAMINAFIVAFCVVELIICSPPSPLRDTWVEAVHPILDYVGLYNRFNMFAPVPPKENYSLHADITYANGETKTWNFPKQQSYKSEFWLPQVKARYQYWQARVAEGEQCPLVLPGAAVYAAHCNYNAANPPTHVRLYRLSQPIELPDAEQRAQATTQIYDYTINPGDLP